MTKFAQAHEVEEEMFVAAKNGRVLDSLESITVGAPLAANRIIMH